MLLFILTKSRVVSATEVKRPAAAADRVMRQEMLKPPMCSLLKQSQKALRKISFVTKRRTRVSTRRSTCAQRATKAPFNIESSDSESSSNPNAKVVPWQISKGNKDPKPRRKQRQTRHQPTRGDYH